MDLKTFLEDFVDTRPIPVATRYAFGTWLQGIGIGMLLMSFLGSGMGYAAGVAGAVFFTVGAHLGVTAYSALKRRYRIVEKSH